MNCKNYKTLIILDWDDTLFPTSWIVKNNINLTDKNTQYKYIVFFSRLDTLLYQLLSKFIKYGKVVIVTNAVTKWITVSSNIIPNTQKLINDKITIISARDIYQEKYPNEMHVWKKLIFKEIVMNYFINCPLQNIISIGDADYEFFALIDLYDKKSFIENRLLKSIRFMRDPSFESLLDQLEVLNKCTHKVLTNIKHMDLKFKDNVPN